MRISVNAISSKCTVLRNNPVGALRWNLEHPSCSLTVMFPADKLSFQGSGRVGQTVLMAGLRRPGLACFRGSDVLRIREYPCRVTAMMAPQLTPLAACSAGLRP
eukprot:scaffold63411_cov17-Prasinocladus_malaysianus.AAC.1